MKVFTRRLFLKLLMLTSVLLLLPIIFRKMGFLYKAPHPAGSSMSLSPGNRTKGPTNEGSLTLKKCLGTSEDEFSHIYLSRNGTPEQNMAKVIEMMGGIKRFIGKNDIIVLKPNLQWWNQGRTNLATMKGFIDLVLNIRDFKGEVIIAENHHFMDESLHEREKDNIRGWTHFSEINGNIDGVSHSLNTMIELYHKQGYKNVTKYHWRDGGPKSDVWGNGQNGGIVDSPAQGDGYVWTDIDYTFKGFFGLKKWKVKMTYPIFTSTYSDITIDFKNGAFERDERGGGHFLPEKPIRFINFAVLNTHGKDTGITSAVKNYMGITDLSCGWWGLKPQGYYNVHQCGESHYAYAKAGPLGYFMKTIRKADLNIVTAEWVGWGHRTEITKATRMKTLLTSTDPISLDYYGAKYLVYPLSKAENHNPDDPKSPVRKFLNLALNASGEGTQEESRMKVHTYDYQTA